MVFNDKKTFFFRVISSVLGITLIIALLFISCETCYSSAKNLSPPTDLSQDVDATIEIDVTHHKGEVNKLLFGNYVIAPGAGNGLLDFNNQFNPNALQMIQELKPSILRLDHQPIFEDAIGELQSRPPARCGWASWHSNEYGIDEHMALLEAIGSEDQALITVGYPVALDSSINPKSCINLSSNSNLSQMVKRAMAWVAYMNAIPSDTTLIGVDDHGFDWGTSGEWAQKRVNNGHSQPYGIKHWELGNEVYYHTDQISPEQYGQDYLIFQEAMKRVDPSIDVAINARLDNPSSEWNARLLSTVGSAVDALSVHLYDPNIAYDPGRKQAIMAGARQIENDLAQLRHLITTNTNRIDEISLFVSEMGIAYDFNQSDPLVWNNLLSGIHGADTIGVLVELSADYNIAIGIKHWLHGAAHDADIHFDWETRDRYKRPDYFALQMWTKHFGDILVENTVTSDTFDVVSRYGSIAPHHEIPYLAAHTSISGERLYLLVINRHLEDDIKTAIQIKGFTPKANAFVYTLNGPSVDSTNEYGNHDTIFISSSKFFKASRNFTYKFPAHSVTVIELLMPQHQYFFPLIRNLHSRYY